MTSKLTVYIDESIRQLLKESAGEESYSKIVNDALESYISGALVKDLSPPKEKTKGEMSYPSLSEVVKRRPKAEGSSAEIISSQRRGRNARLS
jgi:hypothetical protein